MAFVLLVFIILKFIKKNGTQVIKNSHFDFTSQKIVRKCFLFSNFLVICHFVKNMLCLMLKKIFFSLIRCLSSIDVKEVNSYLDSYPAIAVSYY